jgi:hypothetical protein
MRNEPAGKDRTTLVAEYYTRAFGKLHWELAESGYRAGTPHEIRRTFWARLRRGIIPPGEGRDALMTYLAAVEDCLAATLREHSLAYWLHIYRRLAPAPIGADKSPHTVMLTRVALEAAFQKHSRLDVTGDALPSGTVPDDRILGGLLTREGLVVELKGLRKARQLVITDFDVEHLARFYEAEKLAYELWRSTAQLRALGKGAALRIGSPQHVREVRPPELTQLLRIHDSRARYPDHTATGVLHGVGLFGDTHGSVFLPMLNVSSVPWSAFQPMFGHCLDVQVEPLGGSAPNFVWLPFDVRTFLAAHAPFRDAFAEAHGVRLDAVLVLLAAASLWAQAEWTAEPPSWLVRLWKRAYMGPYTREYVTQEITRFAPHAAETLALTKEQVSEAELKTAMDWATLAEERRSDIDLAYPGPHFLFLPYGAGRLFVDYAWIGRRLYDLFLGVRIDDAAANYKADLLENAVRGLAQQYRIRKCRLGGKVRADIDAAFAVGETLIVAECKAAGRPVSFDRGDATAIQHRTDRVVTPALQEVDRKARFLAENPVGDNYDVSGFRTVLPIGVTPFVEFIPSLDTWWWLSPEVARVMTPEELRLALSDGKLSATCWNAVPVRDSSQSASRE